jgi:hypothetical protein
MAPWIRAGYDTRLVIDFLSWEARHGVPVFGALPTGFVDAPIGDDALTAIRSIPHAKDAGSLEPPNYSRDPRGAFFGTQGHLNEIAENSHSAVVVRAPDQLADLTLTDQTLISQRHPRWL